MGVYWEPEPPGHAEPWTPLPPEPEPDEVPPDPEPPDEEEDESG